MHAQIQIYTKFDGLQFCIIEFYTLPSLHDIYTMYLSFHMYFIGQQMPWGSMMAVAWLLIAVLVLAATEVCCQLLPGAGNPPPLPTSGMR